MKMSFLVVVVILIGCAPTVVPIENTEMIPEYVKDAMDAPLTFYFPRGQDDDPWARAQAWIGEYSGMRIQLSLNNVIQTFNPTDTKTGYEVTRAPIKGDMVEFRVCVYPSSRSSMESADRNAHLLAYFIQTGKRHESISYWVTRLSMTKKEQEDAEAAGYLLLLVILGVLTALTSSGQ